MIINLTPHWIDIFDNTGNHKIISIAPSGDVARVDIRRNKSHILKLPTHKGTADVTIYREAKGGKVEGLPPQEDGIYYLVSMRVRLAVPDRTDVLSPVLLVKDGDTKRPGVMGCRGLAQNE